MDDNPCYECRRLKKYLTCRLARKCYEDDNDDFYEVSKVNDFEKKIKGTVAGKLFAFTNKGEVLYEKKTGRRKVEKNE